MEKKIGVVGIPGKWSSETLADAVEAKTGFRLVISMDEVVTDLQNGKVWFREHELTDLDAILVKKLSLSYEPNMLNRLEILNYLNNLGIAVVSQPSGIAGVLNRLTCTTTMRWGNIPIPPTLITENEIEALNSLKLFGEAVFKPLYTSKARGMRVIRYSDTALDEIREYQDSGHRTMYIQKLCTLPGKDLGLVFLGGKYIATYARVNQNGSWNTTTRSGGKYERFDPAESIIDIARKAQSLFNLDFTCVDLAETPEGPVVFEVSAFGGFRGLQVAHNMNAADLLVDHLLQKLGT